jgi:protein O-mannosyl-transferase
MPALPRERTRSKTKKQATPASSENDSPEKWTLILSLLLVVIVLVLYNQATHFSFLNLDDDIYVTANAHVIQGVSWNTFTWAMTSLDGNWHPLTWFSHALDCQLFRLNPTGHHFSNILLHAANVVLLFLLLLRGTKRIGVSFVVAAIFAVHPLNVESVAWISERKNVLSTMFFFLTIAAYGWYSRKPNWKRYLVVALAFACGLASKSMLVTLPFVLLLLDYWPLGRIRGLNTESTFESAHAPLGKLVLEKLPLLLLSIADSVITVIAQRQSGAVGSVARFPLDARLANAIYCYAEYIWKSFWPTRLAPLYPHPGNSLASWKVALAAVFLIAVSALVWKFRSRSYLPAGWLFFLGTLVPVIGLVQVGNQAMADRYTYIPCLGIFVMTVLGAADLADRAKIPRSLQAALCACILLALSALSYRQIGYWKDSLTLWSHTLAVTENNFAAEDGMGGALLASGDTDDAYLHFQRAAAIYPDDPMSHANIGAYLQQHGHLPEAIDQYETVVRLTDSPHLSAVVEANLGSAYLQSADYAKAQASFSRAMQFDPGVPTIWMGMGKLALARGALDDAIQDFSRAVELQPSAQGYLSLGRALAQANRRPEALAAYQQALQLDPDSAEAQRAVDSLSGSH